MSSPRDLNQLEEQVEIIREQVAEWKQPTTEPQPEDDRVAELCDMLGKLHEAEEELREAARS